MSYSDQCRLKFLNIQGGDIPDSEYFKIKRLSNSKLKLINPTEGGSPELFLQGIPFKYNVSLLLGTAVHTQLLQPEDFILSNYEGKPSGKCGYFIEKVCKYRKKGLPLYQAIEKASNEAEYYVGKLSSKILRNAMVQGLEYYLKLSRGDFNVENKEVLVLPKKDLTTVKSCMRSVNKNQDIQRILTQTPFNEKEYYNEIALFSDIEVTFHNGEKHIINFQGKLDSVVVDNSRKRIYLNDVKTTSRPVDCFMGRIFDGEVYNGGFESHHYYRQLACYAVMLQAYCEKILKKIGYTMECNIFAVETTGDHQSRRFKINQSYINEGLKEFKDLICRVAYLEKYGIEQSYPDDI